MRDTENITLFLAYMGQICDMVEEIARSLKAKDIAKQVGDFMKERNNAIHAARIPMGEDHRGVKIAAIAPNDEACGEYRNRIPWDTVDVLKFKPLAEWMATTRDRLFEVLNRPVYPMILKAVRDRFDGREVTPRALAAAEPIKVTVNLPPGSVYSVYQAPLGTWHGGTMVADISGKK